VPIRVEVLVDMRAAQQELRELADKAPLAVARALNKTIRSVQTQTVRAIAADVGLAQKDVRKGLTLELATRQRLLARLAVSTRRIGLHAFRARQTKRGVTYKLPGGRGRVPSGFIARMKSGHVGVFKRWGPKRLPITELRGPSLGRVFESKVAQVLKQSVRQLFDKYLAHEIDFLRRGRG